MLTGKKLREKIAPYAKRLEGISHKHRLSIVYILAHEDKSISDLMTILELPQNLVSFHVSILLKTGWIMKRKDRHFVFYSLKEKNFGDRQKLFAETWFFRNTLHS
jgi:DNA-binding transcriptional ArsR family regulator